MKSFLNLLLFVLTCLCLLSACPANTDTTAQQTTENSPLGRPILFKQTEIYCCWEDLQALAQKKGLDYSALVRQALAGETAALEQLLLFSKHIDLQTSAPHAVALVTLLYGLGDKAFAESLQKLEDRGELKQEYPAFQEMLKETLRNLLETGAAFSSNPALKEFSLHRYSRTSALLGYSLQSSQ